MASQKANPARRPNTQATGSAADAGIDHAAENVRLRKENARLKMEHEILKKTLGILSEMQK